jgi:hypothetical protein
MDTISPGSFRDPSGFLFYRHHADSNDNDSNVHPFSILYRQVNRSYKENYDQLISSGLYDTLVEKGVLVAHQEQTVPFVEEKTGYKVIQPEMIPFISYPYEWSFSQLKDAALTTLQVQKLAFEKGMCLKDSSAYNIQFLKGKPVLIDTLSFEKYKAGEPWVAYGQFCRHFLAPLALMALKDTRLGQLLRVYIDGIPLDLAASLLPASARLNMSLYMHIYLHSKSQKRYENKAPGLTGQRGKVSSLGFQGIIDSLETAVRKLKWKAGGTEWDGYYQDTNYSAAAFQHKKEVVAGFIHRTSPGQTWDLGANTGIFGRIAAGKGILTLSFDMDPAVVEKNYLQVKEHKETHLLPLLLDLANPSPGTGWENRERTSWMERGPVDLILALALVHHLAISNNLPLAKIAAFFYKLCTHLVIEFVPKTDSQVQRLLATRQDVFPHYIREHFEKEFSRYFTLRESVNIKDSQRILYLMKSHRGGTLKKVNLVRENGRK